MPPKPDRLEWEEAVYLSIETQLEACRSDAQAFVEVREHSLEDAWQAGLSPETTAHQLINHATPRR